MYSEGSEKVCSDEEVELRDLIMQNLENCGFLNKIKAELRAGVFLAFEEDGNLKNKIPLFNKKFDDFVNTSEGKLVISLVRELLHYFNLNFTLSVFDPEIAAPSPCFSRSEICDQMNLNSAEIDGPLILALLKENTILPIQKFQNKSKNLNPVTENAPKSILNENLSERNVIQDFLIPGNIDHKEEKNIDSFKIDSGVGSSIDQLNEFSDTSKTLLGTNHTENNKLDEILTNVSKEKTVITEKDSSNTIYKKESNDNLSIDDDPFFDLPVPSEKASFFSFSDVLKDKPENKSMQVPKKDAEDSKKVSLSSLRDLPSLTPSNEWTFSRDPKNSLPSLDSVKSVSSSEASNEEIINLDPKDVSEKKDSDILESNEDSSEKQNSDESIEEDIEEDSSANFDELLNSSLSLGEDQTTDQTVSQVSVVEGTDHIEST